MNEQTHPNHSNSELTQYRLGMIEKTLEAISENLQQLAQLEQKHLETREALNRAFAQIESQDSRVRKLEIEMPTLKLIRGWVITGVVGCTGLLGITLFKLVALRA
jgi:hypothetical protein